MEQPALLEMRNITKEFPGVKALDGVSLTVRPGTVHALMGENGAGKSTLMKCLFGIYAKNAGTIVLDGKEVDFKSSKEALENGVAMVHQELNQALTRSGLAASDIACCVVATLSAPTATPSIACRVQAALGLPENRPAFDVNAACSGFIYAAAAAHGLLSTLGGRYALVIGCEALSRMVDPTDRTTCVLFGDGAGAAVFELAENAPFAVTLGARGNEAIRAGGPAACDTAPITMDGKAVFRFAVEAMPRCLQAVLDRSQKTLSDLDWVVCHQANSRIIDHCVKSLHAEPSKFYKNISRHGNTSAASIPIALHEMAESDLLRPGQTLACIGFGGGLTWGGMLLTYEGRK